MIFMSLIMPFDSKLAFLAKGKMKLLSYIILCLRSQIQVYIILIFYYQWQ
jgi:hypothetical protein